MSIAGLPTIQELRNRYPLENCYNKLPTQEAREENEAEISQLRKLAASTVPERTPEAFYTESFDPEGNQYWVAYSVEHEPIAHGDGEFPGWAIASGGN